MTDARPSFTSFLRKNAALGLLGLAHLPFLTVYFAGVWQLEHYQFFPFALFALAGIYYARADRERIQLSWAGRGAITIDILLLLSSSLTNWPKLTAVSFGFFCFAVTSGTWEYQIRRRLTSLTLLFVVLITPPRGLDLYAIFWLQEKTTWLASRLLEQLGHLHLRRGNIIELPNKQLLVEEACSGVQSLFTVLFLAILIVCWQRRPVLHTALLLPAGFVFAGTMNVFRVVAIAVAWQNGPLDLSQGWQHDALGYVALLVAILLLMSTDALLHFFLAPFDDQMFGPFAGMYSNPFTMIWNFCCGGLVSSKPVQATALGSRRKWLTAGCLGAVALVATSVQGVILYAGGREQVTITDSDLSIFEEGVLPEQVAGFRVFNYSTESRRLDSNWGQYSNIWQLNGSGLSVVVSCDHPFLDWHYLNLCYTGAGWTVQQMGERADDPGWRSATFRLRNEQLGRHGRVIYSHFYANGRPMQPSTPAISLRYVVDRVRHHFSAGLWSTLSEPTDRTTYQIQVFAESNREMTVEQLRDLSKLHLETRTLLKQHYATVRLASPHSNAD
jgi:exosortase